jgi:hypothetical protein
MVYVHLSVITNHIVVVANVDVRTSSLNERQSMQHILGLNLQLGEKHQQQKGNIN